MRAPNPRKRYTVAERDEFLRESNAIEGVRDEHSFRDALEAWNYLTKHKVLTHEVVLTTHKILMRNQRIVSYLRGNYRDCDVFVGMHKMVPPHLIETFVENWLQNVNEVSGDWKKLHVVYENIHPFVDGNGRTGRMFMNWYRIAKCDLPLLVIRTGKEQREYYEWFK